MRYGSQKGFKQQSDLQGHSTVLAMVPFDRPRMISYWIYFAVATFPRYYHLFPKIQKSHNLKHIHFGVIYHLCTSQSAYDI